MDALLSRHHLTKGRILLGDQEKSVMEYIVALRRIGGVMDSPTLVGVANAVMNCTYPEKWDQTVCKCIQCGHWTMNESG